MNFRNVNNAETIVVANGISFKHFGAREIGKCDSR